jgi:MerR family transcriptional regulator/heat shock protein HspR
MPPTNDDRPVFLISVAARLAGMHPQTLREYDRLGLVSPARTAGRGRRYSKRDIEQLREIQRLSQEEGINLAGIRRILHLERALASTRAEVERLKLLAEPGTHRIFAAGPKGEVVVTTRRRTVRRESEAGALVVWRPRS